MVGVGSIKGFQVVTICHWGGSVLVSVMHVKN